eukprot:TRINITY_DN1965_c0_g1_i4.p1 TRINITY_DN1965_c0_g1~~TRINITY_DN1965_c0_g1_i4.p1  ORF type:complete len:280 (+),score=-20.81 TRINITY_DN1965_c0_g1_i4:264-1103(+)
MHNKHAHANSNSHFSLATFLTQKPVIQTKVRNKRKEKSQYPKPNLNLSLHILINFTHIVYHKAVEQQYKLLNASQLNLPPKTQRKKCQPTMLKQSSVRVEWTLKYNECIRKSLQVRKQEFQGAFYTHKETSLKYQFQFQFQSTHVSSISIIPQIIYFPHTLRGLYITDYAEQQSRQINGYLQPKIYTLMSCSPRSPINKTRSPRVENEHYVYVLIKDGSTLFSLQAMNALKIFTRLQYAYTTSKFVQILFVTQHAMSKLMEISIDQPKGQYMNGNTFKK